MMKSVFGLFAGMLLSTIAHAQPSAELEASPLDNNQWRISIYMDEVENVFGLQAELSFDESNVKIINKKFSHHNNWPKQGKVELRNYIKQDGAQYAVSLVRPAKAITLNDAVLQFDIKLIEARATLVVLKTLKISDHKGQVTQFDITNSSIMLGLPSSMLNYYITGAFGLLFLLVIIIIRKKTTTSKVQLAAI